MKKIFLLLVLAAGMNFLGWGQVTLPHYDPLDYTVGTSLSTQVNWTELNTGDILAITSGNLTYPGLPAPTGNKVAFDGSGIDAAKLFTQQTLGTVYFSFILNITALGSLDPTGGYFAGFNEGTTVTYGATVWSRQNGTSYDLGINARTTSTNTVWTSSPITVNSTLFVVIAYKMESGANNDSVKMWINPDASSFSGTEPAPTLKSKNVATLADLANVNRILIRQDSPGETPFIEMDEFRVGTSWADVAPAGSGTTPVITLTPTSLSGFVSNLGSVSPSISYTVSGDNLTADVTVNAPAAYEISTNDIDFYNTLSLPVASGNVTGEPKTVFARIKATAPGGTATGNITHVSGTASTNLQLTGVVVMPVPTNHAASFSATSPSYTTVTTTWLDNDGTQPATGFLVMANTTGTFLDPTNGQQPASDPVLNDGSGFVYVNHGVQTFTWSGLWSSTPYYFKIFAYTNAGSYINYKTGLDVPTATVTTMPIVSPVAAWTFDATAAAPDTPTSLAANFGNQTGTAYLYADGTNGSSTFITTTANNELTTFSGSTLNDPREGTNIVLGNAYALQGGAGTSANGKSFVLKFSMSALQDAILTFATRGTSSGFTTHQWAWSTDGSNFTGFGTNTADNSSSFVLRTLDMTSITQINGAPSVYLKITVSGATNATGNNRFDNFVIRATPVTSVATTAATAVEATTATLNGTVNANNLITDISFEYGTTSLYGSSVAGNPPILSNNVTTPVSADLTGLTQNTLYYFRIIGANTSGTYYGNEMTFTTGCLPTGAAGTITGPATVVADGTTQYTYSVPAIANAATYIWTFPSQTAFVSGENTNPVTVKFLPGATSGNVTVLGVNGCDVQGTESLPFAITVGTPTVPTTLDLFGSYNTVECRAATQTIYVAGNSTVFEVSAPGVFSMIAGQNILYRPGTKVFSGGIMTGKIVPVDPHCPGDAPDVATGSNEAGLSLMDNSFRIYPNPTSGNFTIEQTGTGLSGNVKVEVMGTLGGKILSTELQNSLKQELSIKGNPPGIYFVRVSTGDKVQTVKIILTN